VADNGPVEQAALCINIARYFGLAVAALAPEAARPGVSTTERRRPGGADMCNGTRNAARWLPGAGRRRSGTTRLPVAKRVGLWRELCLRPTAYQFPRAERGKCTHFSDRITFFPTRPVDFAPAHPSYSRRGMFVRADEETDREIPENL
jgi:hypothetical protein